MQRGGSGFDGDFSAAGQGDGDVGGGHRRRVVQAVADEKRAGELPILPLSQGDDELMFLLGGHARLRFRQGESLGGRGVVAGHDAHGQALVFQLRHGRRRRVAQTLAQDGRRRPTAVDGGLDFEEAFFARSLAAQQTERVWEGGLSVNGQAYIRFDALAWQGSHGDDLNAWCVRGNGQRSQDFGDGMGAVPLDGGDDGQGADAGVRVVGGEDFPQGQGVVGEGAGFVEDDAVDFGQPFHGVAAAQHQAASGESAQHRPDGQGRGQSGRAGAGHQQHGHGVEQPGVPVGLPRPIQQREQRNQSDNGQEPADESVGLSL